MFTKKNRYLYIGKHTLFFALLLPLIQSSQLIALGVFKPILLIMPITMGTITGFLVGYHRQKTREYIRSLEQTQTSLEEQVLQQTRELVEKNRALEMMARTDSLTKLGNRIFLKESLEAEAAKVGVENKAFSLMMIDIDYFKNYNDRYGHLKGDEILEILGETLLSHTRETSMRASRFGGEEFCLLMPGYDQETTQQEAQRLLETIRSLQIPNLSSDVSDILTISIGVYTTDKASELQNSTVIQKADQALYMAKTQGRDRFYTCDEISIN
jgi:diguanylate cyclase (GGDEF)-like protein